MWLVEASQHTQKSLICQKVLRTQRWVNDFIIKEQFNETMINPENKKVMHIELKLGKNIFHDLRWNWNNRWHTYFQ